MLFLVVLGLLATPCLGFRLPYIVNGKDAVEGQFPWQASYKTNSNPGSGHNCGASLITERWLITAAHCMSNTDFLAFGQLRRSDETDDDIFSIASGGKFIHPDYGSGPGLFPNDIGLLYLDRDADLDNDNIGTIAMAEADDGNFGGQRCNISGWGRLFGGGPLPDTLQYAETTITTNEACRIFWHSNINDGHVCILDPVNEAGACNGDSGGPLVCHGSNGTPVLVGATSWGPNGCATNYPAVYSRVSYFREWIDEVMQSPPRQ